MNVTRTMNDILTYGSSLWVYFITLISSYKFVNLLTRKHLLLISCHVWLSAAKSRASFKLAEVGTIEWFLDILCLINSNYFMCNVVYCRLDTRQLHVNSSYICLTTRSVVVLRFCTMRGRRHLSRPEIHERLMQSIHKALNYKPSLWIGYTPNTGCWPLCMLFAFFGYSFMFVISAVLW